MLYCNNKMLKQVCQILYRYIQTLISSLPTGELEWQTLRGESLGVAQF